MTIEIIRLEAASESGKTFCRFYRMECTANRAARYLMDRGFEVHVQREEVDLNTAELEPLLFRNWPNVPTHMIVSAIDEAFIPDVEPAA